MSIEKYWQETLAHLQHVLKEDFLILLKTLVVREEGKNEFIMYAPNKYIASSVQINWSVITATLKDTLARHNAQGSLTLQIGRPQSRRTKVDIFAEAVEEIFITNINPNYHFENFVRAPSNESALSLAEAVSRSFSVNTNPLLIYGKSGLGKSHMLHAIGNAMLARGLKRVLYISGEDFVTTYVNALYRKDNKEDINAFTKRLRSSDALLIDDVQFIADKERSQVELFNTYNFLYENNRQIVLASDRLPREMDGLEERLKSRFGHGVTVYVGKPEYETRLAILQKKAADLHFDLPREVAEKIASNVTDNVRELEGALRTLYSQYIYAHKTPTVESVQLSTKVIDIPTEPKNIDIDTIRRLVVHNFEITMPELMSKRRGKANIVLARQVAMSLAKDVGGLSYKQIGAIFDRSHSTIIHAHNLIQKKCLQEVFFASRYAQLKEKLTNLIH